MVGDRGKKTSANLSLAAWEKGRAKKKEFKTAEELKLVPEASANYGKIVDMLHNIDSTIDKGDDQCKKVLDSHEKQFLVAYRVSSPDCDS